MKQHRIRGSFRSLHIITTALLTLCLAPLAWAAPEASELPKAGFTHVYNITDGMEGDAVKDPESLFKGQRLKNGWKNSGNPWTYQPNPEQMRFVTNETEETSK